MIEYSKTPDYNTLARPETKCYFISLTNMVTNQEEGSKLIEKWLTNKNTIEFLGIWEQLNNKTFNSPEFGGIMNEAGTNRFYMSVKQWVSKTNAIGITARTGSQGGTYAHRDIAFNFGLCVRRPNITATSVRCPAVTQNTLLAVRAAKLKRILNN